MRTSQVIQLPPLEHAQYALEHAEWAQSDTDEYDPMAEAQIAQAAALIAQVEADLERNKQLTRIADALNSIDGVLVNASGPMGAISVDVRQE